MRTRVIIENIMTVSGLLAGDSKIGYFHALQIEENKKRKPDRPHYNFYYSKKKIKLCYLSWCYESHFRAMCWWVFLLSFVCLASFQSSWTKRVKRLGQEEEKQNLWKLILSVKRVLGKLVLECEDLGLFCRAYKAYLGLWGLFRLKRLV